MPDIEKNRNLMVNRLIQDLVGPYQESETLESRPSDRYLTGILWPSSTGVLEEDEEELGIVLSEPSSDSDQGANAIARGSTRKPSVAGLSFCVAGSKNVNVDVKIMFATYAHMKDDDGKEVWVRKSYDIRKKLEIVCSSKVSVCNETLDNGELVVRLNIRYNGNPTRSFITLTIMNESTYSSGWRNFECVTIFQVSMHVVAAKGSILIPKPDQYSDIHDDEFNVSGDWNDEGTAMLYRNVHEFAVGHVCSAQWEPNQMSSDNITSAQSVSTTWLPSTIVPSVDGNGHDILKAAISSENIFNGLSAKTISTTSPTDLTKGLLLFCNGYGQWLKMLLGKLETPGYITPNFRSVAKSHLKNCQHTLDRIESSAREMETNAKLCRSFQLANFVMDLQYSWTHNGENLRWRPFQLAYLLLSIPSTVDRNHPDREFMDLLWFPTGGGKTEAYLALVACLSIYKRLSDDTLDHDGVYAIMRYTLRLLTTQQFTRAAAVIIALEAVRSGRVIAPEGLELQGEIPFSIGLWVGGEATPNTRKEAIASRSERKLEQLSECPACHQKLVWMYDSSPIVPKCINDSCHISGKFPVYTIDEDIYHARPTLLIGTIDKFAQLVRNEKTHELFSLCRKTPPDLILQDELHLISGPLGTIAGAYETAFDLIFMRENRKVKIVGSTATIKMAKEQVRALFDRKVFQFPPPGLNHDDSGFAVFNQSKNSDSRQYLGISTVGRSAKFTLQAVSSSLLQSAYSEFDDSTDEDNYWTLIGYFNSIRELGGALALMHDDVPNSIGNYATIRNERQRRLPVVAELTSRRTQKEILDMLQRLSFTRGEPGALDVVLASNMLSVGVDIPRLDLMVVNGQPKSNAEYIQSSSRVGRKTPGLIVTILNNSKARDRSHYETFCNWHSKLYRDVEATSVTPFASRARDRTLHAALVGAVRHSVNGMLSDPKIDAKREREIHAIIDLIVDRANRIDPDESAIRNELESLVQKWKTKAPLCYWNDWDAKKSLLQSAEKEATRMAAGYNASSAWPTQNSMRNVEPSTPIRMATTWRLKE